MHRPHVQFGANSSRYIQDDDAISQETCGVLTNLSMETLESVDLDDLSGTAVAAMDVWVLCTQSFKQLGLVGWGLAGGLREWPRNPRLLLMSGRGRFPAYIIECFGVICWFVYQVGPRMSQVCLSWAHLVTIVLCDHDIPAILTEYQPVQLRMTWWKTALLSRWADLLHGC